MTESTLRTKTSGQLTKGDLKEIHRLMVESRVAEDNLIAMYRRGDGYFWIGGPGEEAFGVPLGLQVKKGEGPDYDYLHLHYRGSATYLGMGGNTIDLFRQMRSTVKDPFSGGRNFSNHIAVKAWNIVPVTSTIETQYSQAPGTAWVQKRHGGDGLSIVTGGDAGAAEGDFASCLVWSSRPGNEVPLLIVVTNNEFGISTEKHTQWAMENIASRAEPFGIPVKSFDGNDVFQTWDALHEAMAYIRTERKPYCVQANVSRLNGHSSASGAERNAERDCLAEFEEQLLERKVMSKKDIAKVWDDVRERQKGEIEEVRKEAFPEPGTIFDHIYAEAEG